MLCKTRAPTPVVWPTILFGSCLFCVKLKIILTARSLPPTKVNRTNEENQNDYAKFHGWVYRISELPTQCAFHTIENFFRNKTENEFDLIATHSKEKDSHESDGNSRGRRNAETSNSNNKSSECSSVYSVYVQLALLIHISSISWCVKTPCAELEHMFCYS